LDSNKITYLNKFLSQDDIEFIFNLIPSLEIVRNENEIFFRSLYLVEREDSRFQFLFDKCDKAIFDATGEHLLSHQLYFIKYFKGDYIKRHNDEWDTDISHGRLYSLVAQMTHPNLYKGGDTLVYDNDKVIKLSKEQGNGIIFPSSMDHELTEITEGERFSFVVMFKETLSKVVI
jgi:Rps23 Pro-64 3,4-dihydroxylase Tpa1-like proline 4-hydroxylase|tara:strand:- start:160 stop:684 length:525 start_codon:yes stop_codon:yes gene_type:complete